uniref:Uncharacterized protein n=1 Tax=Lygus hesperus TaxID=30085 RepID=A0A0A9WYH9_LYGHE
MYNLVAVFFGLTLLAKSNALPVGNGIGNGITLQPVALNDFYNQEVVLVSQPIKYGLGFDKNGVISGGFRFERTILGKPWAISFALQANPNDLKNTFKFEIGSRILKGLAGVLYGDKNGLKWLTSFWAPVTDGKRGLHAFGLSVEGENSKPVALGGGVGVNNEVYQGRVSLDKDLKPFGTNIIIGGSPTQHSFLNHKY